MTSEPNQLEHRERNRWGVWCTLISLVVVVYVLSPPFVAWLFDLKTSQGIYVWNSGFRFIYAPLIYLSRRSDTVHELYVDYFDLFPVHDETAGFGRVTDVIPY